MNEPSQRSGGQHNWARNAGLFTGACGAIAAAAGVDEFVQVALAVYHRHQGIPWPAL
jgi:hypothetical protein